MVKKQIYSIGLCLASILFAFSSVILPGIFMNISLLGSVFCFFISIILSCVCFAFSVIFSPSLWVVGIGVILSFLGTWFVFGSATSAILFLLIFVPVGVALGFGYRNQKILNDTVMAAAINATVLGLIAFAVLIGESSGGSFDITAALEPISKSFEDFLVGIFTDEAVASNPLFFMLGTTPKAFAFFLYSYIISNIPTFYMSFILFEAVVSFWIIKSIMKRTKESVSFMGRFCDCKVSFIAVVFYCISNIVCMLFPDRDFTFAFSNYSNILNLVFIYAGISLIAYFLEFKNFGTVTKNIILVFVIVIGFTSPILSVIVSMLGFFDSGINIRNRLQNSGF